MYTPYLATSLHSFSRSGLVALAGLGLAATTFPAHAQPAPRTPTLTVETSHAGKTDVEARGVALGEVGVTRATASLDLPLEPLSEATTLSADFGYSGFFLDLSGPIALPEKLEALEAGISARHRLDERWSLLARASVGVAGSEGSFSSDGFNAGLFALASYQFSDTFSAGFGFVYNSLSESLPVIPVAGVRWDFAPDWRFTLAFPSTRVTWTANDRLTLRVSLDFDTGSFYVENDPRPATIGVGGRPSVRDTILDYTAISAGLGASYALTEALTLDAAVGYNFSRTADYDERNYEIEADGGAPIGRLGLTYSF